MISAKEYIYLIQFENTDRYQFKVTTKEPKDKVEELNRNRKLNTCRFILIHFTKVKNADNVKRDLHKFYKIHFHNNYFCFSQSFVQKKVKRKMNKYQKNRNYVFWTALVIFLFFTPYVYDFLKTSNETNTRICRKHHGGKACG